MRFLGKLLGGVSHTRNKRKGATAAEMALLTPVFFLLLVGITELSLVLAAQQLLENAAFNAARLAKTGYVTTGATQAQTVLKVVTDELGSFGNLIDVSKVTTVATSFGTFTSAGTGSGGTSGYGTAQQIVTYTITYPWKLFTPMIGSLIGTWDTATNSWVLNLTSRIVIRNEPYS